MITQYFQIKGMTCEGCKYKVINVLENTKGVQKVEVILQTGKATIETQEKISLDFIKANFAPFTKYEITEIIEINTEKTPPKTDFLPSKSWLNTYKPILLIFGYIFGISFLIAFQKGTFALMTFMQVFMGGFFLVFSFFKMLNLKAFAESYAMYDIVAKHWKIWGYIYPFVELGLGIAFIMNLNHFYTNLITLIVMSISIIGVLESVFSQKKIRCACLGSVFELPMSTITIIEDGLMIMMSVLMLGIEN
jgi:copper chaperone CopZ